MPFCKRTILPKDVCKQANRRLCGGGGGSDAASEPPPPPPMFGELVDVCGFALVSVLRQLSDLSRRGVSILEELEGELVSLCRRSGALHGKVVGLQRHVAALVSKPPPPRTASGLEAESGRRGGAGSSSSLSGGGVGHNNRGHGNSSSSISTGGGGGGGAAHFRSPWQQSVNVFGSWSRPECVEELHQQAQLNLQSLLQDFEEQLYDTKLTGQTFRHPSSQSSDDVSTSLSRSPVSLCKRPDFIFLPASKQLYDDETTSSVFGLRGVANPSPSPSPSPCGSDHRPPVGAWSSNNNSGSSSATTPTAGPPVADKPRWHLGRRTPAHLLPLDVTGGEGGGGRFLGVDLLQCSSSVGEPCPSQPHSLELVSDAAHQHLPLRKTHSDLDAAPSLEQHPEPTGAIMDHSGLLCSNTPPPSWNGPKGSTFSPGGWNEAYSYSVNNNNKAPPAVPPKQHSIVGGGPSASSGGSCTFAIVARRSETEGAAAAADGGRGGVGGGAGDGGRGRERSARSIAAAQAFKFRERSLSTPTDSPGFFAEDSNGAPSSAGNGSAGTAADDHHNHHLHHQYPHHHHHHFLGSSGESYALLYPSGSSEDSASNADTVSVTTVSDYSGDGGGGRLPRVRSRSISLKKSKRKPPPPVRSVSLMKNLGEAEGHIHHGWRDGRPKSLHIPRDHFPDFQPDFLLPSSACLPKPSLGDAEQGHSGSEGPPSLEIQGPERDGEAEITFPAHWQLGEWKNDPYRSLSGSSTATGTTVIECLKVRGSSESLLDSPSTSRAASPSQLSMEADVTKASSPFKPPGLMSPSSGYSSQSETPTPTVPPGQAPGTAGMASGTLGCKMRPKIPERKSSLPSPKDPAARSRLSCEIPVNALLPDLSSLRPKQKAGRRHSDTSTAAKPGKMPPPGGNPSQQPVMVTQNELKTVRLRSVSRGDLEDCPDGAAAADTIEEEERLRAQEHSGSPVPPPTAPKPKPPVAVKPPLPKRPLNLLLKSPSPSSSSTSPLGPESPPGSPVDRPVPLGNIYKVMRKPKAKKAPPAAQSPTSPSVSQDAAASPVAPQIPYDFPFLPVSQSFYDLPPLPDPQPLLEDPGMEPEFDPETELHLGPADGGSLPSPCSSQEAPELQDKSKTLPSRMTISCLAELSDKKKPKVPPPVPKKPSVLLLPSSVLSSSPASPANGGVDRGVPLRADSPARLRSPVAGALSPDRFPEEFLPPAPAVPEREDNHVGTDEDSSKDSSLQSSLQDSSLTEISDGKAADAGNGAGIGCAEEDAAEEDNTASNEKTQLHIAEETDDGLLAHTPTTHTTEDLFTIIHRSKRKVLGRKEPTDSYGSRQSLTSPVKHSASGGDLRTMTLGGQRSSSRNENFIALLQKKGSKSSSGGARVSAMELLKSTNPLARRVTEFAATPPSAANEEGCEAGASGNGAPNDH